VVTAGAVVLVGAATRIEGARGWRVPLPVAVFLACVVAGELLPLSIQRRGAVKELLVTSAFAYALVPVGGTSVAVLATAAGCVLADLVRRKAIVKVAFNAAQYVLALTAAGSVHAALGGGVAVNVRTLPAMIGGALAFLVVNHALVSVVVTLADGGRLPAGLLRDLPVELSSSLMLLALTPVAVLIAERTLLLLPGLLLPIAAAYRASKGEVLANQRRVQAEQAVEHQRRLTAKEQQLVRELQQADRLKADLLAVVSHELRSPLTTILGALRTVHARGEHLAPTDRQELLTMSLRQGDRLQQLIEQLLLAAKFEEDDHRPATSTSTSTSTPSHADLSGDLLVRQVAAEAQARHHDRPIILVDTDTPVPVRAAHDAVVQILANLVDNACKYSPSGYPVHLSALRDGAQAVLAVEDRGPGIPVADRQRIFERFTQLESHLHRQTGGVGLGLYIARQLARGQGGDLLVTDATHGHGARFELRLPLQPAPATAPPLS
jgi:signal transduction histidine kinase